MLPKLLLKNLPLTSNALTSYANYNHIGDNKGRVRILVGLQAKYFENSAYKNKMSKHHISE